MIHTYIYTYSYNTYMYVHIVTFKEKNSRLYQFSAYIVVRRLNVSYFSLKLSDIVVHDWQMCVRMYVPCACMRAYRERSHEKARAYA